MAEARDMRQQDRMSALPVEPVQAVAQAALAGQQFPALGRHDLLPAFLGFLLYKPALILQHVFDDR